MMMMMRDVCFPFSFLYVCCMRVVLRAPLGRRAMWSGMGKPSASVARPQPRHQVSYSDSTSLFRLGDQLDIICVQNRCFYVQMSEVEKKQQQQQTSSFS